MKYTDPQLLRSPDFRANVVSIQEFKAKRTRRHKFRAGQRCRLVGLVDFPEFNGQIVTVGAIRDDEPKGRTYYITGEINTYMNWVFEYRLEAIK